MARGALDSAGHPAREGRHPGPHRQVSAREPGHRWWQVGCLTGVDYFPTIGYQPAIAWPRGSSPLATIVLVLVTLLGALPVYRRVATQRPLRRGVAGHARAHRFLVDGQDPGLGAAGLRRDRLPDHDDPGGGGHLDAGRTRPPPNYSRVVTGLLCPARVVEGATRQRFAVPDRRIPSCSVAVPSLPRRPLRSYCSP